MSNLARLIAFPPTSKSAMDKIGKFQARQRQEKQIEFVTEHVFHAGMYARTVRIPTGVLFTNVTVKCPTLVIIEGNLAVTMDEDSWVEMKGYNVVPASAGRKQIYLTLSEVKMTMIFPTSATTVEQAESEFTDEAENLLSHFNENDIVSTTCLESPLEPRS